MMNGTNFSWSDGMNCLVNIWGAFAPHFFCLNYRLAIVKKLTRQNIDSRAVKKMTGTLTGFSKIYRSGFSRVAPLFCTRKKM